MCEAFADLQYPLLFDGPDCSGAQFPAHDRAHIGHIYHILPPDFVVRSVHMPPHVDSPQLGPFYAQGELPLNSVPYLQFVAVKEASAKTESSIVYPVLLGVLLLVLVVVAAVIINVSPFK
jgi:hypothetical protein